MRSIIQAIAVAAAFCAGASAGGAQQRYDLEPGTRVRLVGPGVSGGEQVVRIVAAGGDTVAFRSERESVTRTLPIADIQAVDVSMGERRQVMRGAGLGLALGAGIGIVLGYATYEPCDGWCILGPSSRSESAAFGGIGGGVLGLLVGTTIGVFNKTEKWQRVQPNTSVGLVPARGGAGIAISHAF